MIPRLQTVLGFAMRQSELMMEESARLSERASSLARNLEQLPGEELRMPTSEQQEIGAPMASIAALLPGLSVTSESDEDDDGGAVQEDVEEHSTGCSCNNCSTVLDMFNECLICRNPLQNRGVHDCSSCGKVWCTECSLKLVRCGFCRRYLINPLKPSRTLTTMVDGMMLPCAYKSNGCATLLTAKQRKRHERRCQFGVDQATNIK